MGDECPSARPPAGMKWVSLLVIFFALGAIAGGFISGASVAHVRSPAVAVVDVPASDVASQGDETADDAFSDDQVDTVPQIDSRIDAEAHLAFVIVSAGHSVALESPFLALDMPLTVVVDPHGPASRTIAGLAQSAQKSVYIQLDDEDATGETIPALLNTFPAMRGVAARFAPGSALRANIRAVAKAAARAHLGVFDEFADDSHVRAAVVGFGASYAGRSLTVDNHLAPAYVAFMLDQAVRIARARPVIVMARPFPATLAAARRLAAASSKNGIETEPLIAQAPGSQGE